MLALSVRCSRDITVRAETGDRALTVLVDVVLLELADPDDLRRDDDEDSVDAARGGDRGGTCSAGCNSNGLSLLFTGGALAFTNLPSPDLVGSGGGLDRELLVLPTTMELLLLLLLPPPVLATIGALAFNDDAEFLSDVVGRGGGGPLDLVVLSGSGSDSASACLCSGNSLLIFLGEPAVADHVRRHTQAKCQPIAGHSESGTIWAKWLLRGQTQSASKHAIFVLLYLGMVQYVHLGDPRLLPPLAFTGRGGIG